MRSITIGFLTRRFRATLASLFLFLGVIAAHAQAPNLIYNFSGGADGGKPNARLTLDAAGNLYGTTEGGGLGFGIVFKLSPNGGGGWNETVLYRFTGGPSD